MSPDQRWLAFRKFYPARTELPVTEEYLVYDLTKTPAQNRNAAVRVDNYTDVGLDLFPLGQKN